MSLGISRAQCAKVIRLEHCKVAEFQRRGLVHFHAVVRADGPGGSPPPIDVGLLATACLASIRSVEIAHARGTVRWGSEVDLQPLCRDERSGRVASYVAKYATKEAAMHPGLLGRILSVSDLKGRGLPPHIAAVVATAWALGADPLYRDLGLRRHAHRLGYSGHFLTKSRGYSTTFGALPRGEGRLAPTRGVGGESGVTARRLRAVGRGWSKEGEELFAAAQARQRAEEKKEADFVWHTRCE